MRRIVKSFGGAQALRGVSLESAPGEVHALVGENGAGKSTLMKILAGHHYPDAGEIALDGNLVRFRSPHEALDHGIAMVAQEPLGFPDLTAAENVFLGGERDGGTRFWVNRRRQEREAARLFARLGLPLDPVSRLRDLGLAHQQGVAMARALAHRARILILDEPTSALSAPEAAALFGVIHELRRGGVTLLYVSHRLEEVLQLADRVTVLRDGVVVAAAPATAFDPRRLVSLMAGRELAEEPRARAGQGAEGDMILEVQGLGRDRAFQNVSFHLRRGEIIGLAGLAGAGRSEVAGAIYGLEPADRGEIRVRGRPVRITGPAQAQACGIAMVTEDRHISGIIPPLSLRHHLTLSSLDRCSAGPWVLAGQEAALASTQVRTLAIRASGLDEPVRQLSGGNQQKALLGRALLTQPSLLILDEPTRGIDVAAKAEIHRLIRGLARQGLAVLVVSSELPEILALSDRILVMREGRVVACVNTPDTSADEILQWAMPG